MSVSGEYRCYTDGSCKAVEGAPGGWGFVINHARLPTIEGHGSASGTLAKVMEYRAVAEALLALPARASATVFCDNQSLIENMTRHLANWASSEFVNVDAFIVDSARSIQSSITHKQLNLRWQWVRAHNGNAGNERADALAAQGAREAKAALPRKKR